MAIRHVTGAEGGATEELCEEGVVLKKKKKKRQKPMGRVWVHIRDAGGFLTKLVTG